MEGELARHEEMMIDYAVALTFPSEFAKKLNGLREKYNQNVGYTIEPHLTLVYPFLPEVNIGIIEEKLDEAGKRTKPFTLLLKGIEYFEGVNNVAYAAIENKEPVTALHADIMRSLNGLIKEEYTDGQYNIDKFIPHVTIGEQIPDDVFPTVKRKFSDYELHYETEITSFTLFSGSEDGVWKKAEIFGLSG